LETPAPQQAPPSAGAAKPSGLPSVRKIGFDAPGRWLASGWRDFLKAPLLLGLYGLGVGALALAVCAAVWTTHGAYWALALVFACIFMAPMLAMGLYEAGRLFDAGEKPSFAKIFFLRHALRVDVAYLGLALLFICFFWLEIAHVTYALSTFRMHKSFEELAQFAFATPAGNGMLIAGSIIGGAIGFFVFSLVVTSAPMLLDKRSNAFVAVLMSLLSVARNLPVMALWALILVVLTLLAALTGFTAMIVLFPVLALASWRAYRELIDHETPLKSVTLAR
jgi:uncharacterized membrane protein